ncbi:MAG: phytoene/squalene synthase family protein [Verrucomicrobiia bacterium]
MNYNSKRSYDDELDEILKGVSRSFYLTLRFLPREIRPQVCIAYLIARASDTIADTCAIPAQNRVQYLTMLRERINGNITKEFENVVSELKEIQDSRCSEFERRLLNNIDQTISVMESFDEADIELIRAVIRNITTGQELDLRRFLNSNSNNIICLNSDKELDEYTYFVAGCVGEFWTKICLKKHLFADSINETLLIENGINYGKGLQLINILRDLPSDLKTGRCYIPVEMLKKHNLTPYELTKPENEKKFRPLYNLYINRAYSFLNCGSDYIKMIPQASARLKIATSFPLLIGFKTLGKLSTENVLNPDIKIKISRHSVWSSVILLILAYPFEPLFRRFISQKSS